MSKIKVAVIFGGKSTEHDVSLVSAANIIENIPKDKYSVITIGITKKGHWLKFIGDTEQIKNGEWETHPDNVPCVLSPDPIDKGFIATRQDGTLQKVKVDVIFPALHGKNGEDGTIQGLFELADIPYVGCNLISSANCMDKAFTHLILEANGIKTAKWVSFKESDVENTEKCCKLAESKLTYPMFVKPANSGSSVGISRVENTEELKKGIMLALAHDEKVVVEQGVTGMECECAVMGNEKPFASTVGEICSANTAIYDYDAKYNDSTSQTIIPARMSEENIEKIREIAVKAYKCLDCSGLARVDFFLADDGEVILNEINTLPGHTPISMYPKLMENYGLTPSEQEDKLIRLALDKAGVDYE